METIYISIITTIIGSGLIGAISHIMFTKTTLTAMNERIKSLEKSSELFLEHSKEFTTFTTKMAVLEERFSHLSDAIKELTEGVRTLNQKIK